MESQIAGLASTYLTKGKPTGARGFRADCPLCGSPRSFVISTLHGGWLCYSCQESGSLTAFLYKIARLTRKQVDRAMENLSLPPPLTQRQQARKSLREGWSLLPEYILGAYEELPPSLLSLGFTEETLKSHDVGLDTPHNRIVFPLRDMLGRLVGISGRALTEWQIPRYKVYDAAPPSQSRKAGEFYGVVDHYVPDNRKHLYGFHTVYPRRFFTPDESTSPLIITEGYKSTLWLRQMGFTDAVGLQGSSLTEVQLRQLGRLRGPYYIMLDHEPGKAYPDRKGLCAAITIAHQLRTSGRVYLCTYEGKPIGTAPDDLKDPAYVTNMIQQAKTLGHLRVLRG